MCKTMGGAGPRNAKSEIYDLKLSWQQDSTVIRDVIWHITSLMMMTEMGLETSVSFIRLMRLIV
jgi:hypothetical protein